MDFEALFRENGLARGRHYGSKSAYRASNPNCLLIANAAVFVLGAGKVWGGDLDLASADASRVTNVAKQLGKPLYIHREIVEQEGDGYADKAIVERAEAVVRGDGVTLSPQFLRSLAPGVAGSVVATRSTPPPEEG